jgi:predicted dehydrogenase
MERLRAAIVGCGGISATYVDLYTQFPDMSRLVAFCDVAAERAHGRSELARQKLLARAQAWRESAAAAASAEDKARFQRWAATAADDAATPFAVYSDYQQVAQDAAVDVVIVCTPPPVHAAPSVAALDAGKHVFCQGPMATTLRDADAMIRAAEAAGTKLAVQYLTRFTREAECARRLIQEGFLGELILSGAEMLWYRDDAYYAHDAWRGTWTGEGGGAFFHHARYVMDLYLWCIGTPVSEVFAWMGTRARAVEVEDVLTASLRFRDGSLGKVSATVGAVGNTAIPRDRIEVFGERGSVSLIPNYGRNGWRLSTGWINERLGQEAADWLDENVPEQDEDPTRLQTRKFLECIRDDTEPPISGQSARAQVELTRAAYQSAHTGRPVRLPLTPDDPYY